MCFKCEEKYTVGHQCRNCELRVLLVEGECGEEEKEGTYGQIEEKSVEVKNTIELSLNNVVGLSTPGTMKLKGKSRPQEVTILIDCGATHNFISLELVQKLGPPTKATTNYGIIMGTGQLVKGRGICKGVVVEVQGLTIVHNFLPLALGCADVVLGMQWLRSLGDMEVNWKGLTMQFRMGDK